MIFSNTNLYVLDNSGAIRVSCIKAISHFSKFNFGKLNDIFLITTKRILPKKKVKKGEKYKFLLLNSKYKFFRVDLILNFWFNTGILLKKDDIIPLSSRIFIITLNELRFLNYKRILTMGKPNI